MATTRRDLFRMGLGGCTLLACGTTVPTFLARSAAVLAAGSGAEAKGRVLVVLQLDGGNDGLNTVVPYRDEDYRRLRPTLRIAANDVRKIDDRAGLHPALGGFATLLEDQRLTVVQGVGYPNPTRSHFESMATWHTARVGPAGDAPGWLARTIDARSATPGGDPPALHVDAAALPQALCGGRHHVPSMVDPKQFRRRIGDPDPAGAADQGALLDGLARVHRGSSGSLLEFVEQSTLNAVTSAARLECIAREARDAKGYPEYWGLARRLRLIAQLIKAGLTTSIYYVQLGGFDTHANQLASHGGLLRELGDSVRAFLDDLNGAGEGDRVLVLTFSEFGRRLRENASGGTDHGTAAPVFLSGRGVRAGLHGPYPDLQDLEDDDPKHAIDFRRVYATVLGGWLSLHSDAVLGGAFETLPLLTT